MCGLFCVFRPRGGGRITRTPLLSLLGILLDLGGRRRGVGARNLDVDYGDCVDNIEFIDDLRVPAVAVPPLYDVDVRLARLDGRVATRKLLRGPRLLTSG